MTSSNTIPSNTHTLIAVHRPASSTKNTSLFRYQSGGSYVILPYYGTSALGYVTSYDGTAINAASSNLLENSVTTRLNVIIATISSGSQVVFRDGTQQNSNTQSITTSTTTTLNIGSSGGTSEFYQGDLAEMIVYSRNITSVERQIIEAYLSRKWGLLSNLSSGNIYKNTSPILGPE
jgi:hypothetical protein